MKKRKEKERSFRKSSTAIERRRYAENIEIISLRVIRNCRSTSVTNGIFIFPRGERSRSRAATFHSAGRIYGLLLADRFIRVIWEKIIKKKEEKEKEKNGLEKKEKEK